VNLLMLMSKSHFALFNLYECSYFCSVEENRISMSKRVALSSYILFVVSDFVTIKDSS
jgi:hypothetical protein